MNLYSLTLVSRIFCNNLFADDAAHLLYQLESLEFLGQTEQNFL